MTRYTSHGRGWSLQRELARDMRHLATPAEALLWERLRGRRLAGAKFRRQHPIGRFIADFYCVEAGLVIEVDGPVHQRTKDADAARQEFLEGREIRVLRFTNNEVMSDVERVVETIATVLAQRACRTSPSPLRGEGAGGVRCTVNIRAG